MSSSQFSLLCQVKDLIERDALIQFLVAQDIDVQATDRDMFVQYGDQINLSLGAYSAFFDGYPVMVKSMQLKRAKEALREFQERLRHAIGMAQVGTVAAIGIRAAGRGLMRHVATLDLLKVREDRLLDQPVRRAVDGLGDALEAIARGVIELDAEGGGGHASCSP